MGIHAQTAGRRAHPALRPLGSQVPFGRRARRGRKFYCMTGLSEALARLQPSVRFQRSLPRELPSLAATSPARGQARGQLARGCGQQPLSPLAPGPQPPGLPGRLGAGRPQSLGPRPGPTELDFGGWQTQQEVGGAKGEKTATFFPFLSRIHASHPAFKEEGVCLINSKAVEPAPEARGARLLAVGQAWRAAFCLSHLTSSAQ